MTGVCKILIVDGEPRTGDSLSIILSSNGYQIDTVGSGREAIDCLTEKIYDLVLADIGLPDMNAHMVIDNILSSSPETAVIILTWRASIKTAVEALKKGVYDYIEKPCDYDTLLKTIIKAVKHKKLEINLKKSETKFRRLLEVAWEGILIHNKGVFMQANKQFFDMFGYDPDELAGKQIIPLTVTPESMGLINQNIASDRKGTYNATGLRKDGSIFPMEIRTNPMEYYGKIAGVAAIRDTTERKKAEQDKLKLQKELARARKMEELGLMTGSLAHDLNNILSGIVSYPELIVMDLPKESRLRKPIETIQKSGQKAAAVVSDLSTIANGTTNHKDVLNLNLIISKYLLSSEYRELKARYPHIRITTKLKPELLNIHCALMHMNKVLANLVLNAAEAIEYNGDITITTRNRYIDQPLMGYDEINPGEYVMLTVTDNGIGLSPKDLGRIFEPFYTKKVMGRNGTGLGMAVVWNIVKDLDGGINVITSANGTAFQIYFHITRDKITETNRGESIAPKEISANGENLVSHDDYSRRKYHAVF